MLCFQSLNCQQFLEIFNKNHWKTGFSFQINLQHIEEFFQSNYRYKQRFILHNLAKLDLIATLLNGPYDQQNKDMSRYTFNCCINFPSSLSQLLNRKLEFFPTTRRLLKSKLRIYAHYKWLFKTQLDDTKRNMAYLKKLVKFFEHISPDKNAKDFDLQNSFSSTQMINFSG